MSNTARRLTAACACIALTHCGPQPTQTPVATTAPAAAAPIAFAEGSVIDAHTESADVAEQPEPTHATADAFRDAVRPTIQGGLATFARCYQQAASGGHAHDGRVVVRFTVAPDGDVGAVAVRQSTVGDPATERCLVESLDQLHFAVMPPAATTVDYPFELRLPAAPSPADAATSAAPDASAVEADAATTPDAGARAVRHHGRGR